LIRPFDLRDAKLVTRLQQVGTPLDIEEQLTHPRSPLRSVLINSILSPHAGPSTFILDQQDENGRLLGLAQMRARPGRPEQDVVFMSPALDAAGNGNHAIWQRLLTHLCVQTAERGYFRLYASLPVDSEEFHLFKNIGFLEYSQEDIYQLAPESKRAPLKTTLPLRPQCSNDGWGLQKLYAALTPRPVQNAEGLAQGQWALIHRRWGEQGRLNGYVWEEAGDLLGALHIRSGKRGYWIRTLLHPDALDQTEMLARAALNLTINNNPRLPVYFALRHYEAGWCSVLTDLGFKPLTSQTLVVKPMTVRIRDKSPVLMPALEKSPSEGAPTTAISRAQIMEPQPQNGHSRL
jgi:hypothetical protein